MTNAEMAAELAEKARDHAVKAGMVANDVEVKARIGGLLPSARQPEIEHPALIAVAAQAHAHAAMAYREASQAYALLPALGEARTPSDLETE